LACSTVLQVRALVEQVEEGGLLIQREVPERVRQLEGPATARRKQEGHVLGQHENTMAARSLRLHSTTISHQLHDSG